MKDQNQNDIICFQEHKICYTEREAGTIVTHVNAIITATGV